MDEPLGKTPLYEWHQTHGGRLVDFAGWSMPVQYTSIVEEHMATRQSAALFDVSHMGRFLLRGPALEWLDTLLTRRVVDLSAGRVRYSLVTKEDGGVLDDILVYHMKRDNGEPLVLLVVNASNRLKIWNWLQQHLSTDQPGAPQVTMEDVTLQTAMIAIQGPAACAHAAQMLQLTGLDRLRSYAAKWMEGTSGWWIYSRTGYTGEDGLELIVPAPRAVDLWQRLLQGDGPRVLPAGLGARDTLRLEAAMPLYGHELSEEMTAAQAGLDFALDLNGRSFPGREAIAAARQSQDLPLRVGLKLEGKRVARENYPICDPSGKPIGRVTSGTFSPTLQQSIAMGYVQPAYGKWGTSVSVDVRGRLEAAQIVRLPFYQRGQ